MEIHDLPAFLDVLNNMASLFCDELSQTRQRLYWQLLREDLDLEEWQVACHRAMLGETFYKVPLPRVLMDYVREWRHEQRACQAAPVLRHLDEDPLAQAQVQALINSVWPQGDPDGPAHDQPRARQ